MKLTEENADYMDCRPDFDEDPINMDLVPEHMRARVLAGRTARAAKAPLLAARTGTEAKE